MGGEILTSSLILPSNTIIDKLGIGYPNVLEGNLLIATNTGITYSSNIISVSSSKYSSNWITGYTRKWGVFGNIH